MPVRGASRQSLPRSGAPGWPAGRPGSAAPHLRGHGAAAGHGFPPIVALPIQRREIGGRRSMISRMLTAIAVAAFVAFGVAGAAQAQDAATKKLMDTLRKEINANKALAAKTKAYTIKTLLPLSTNALFIKETLAQNAKKMPMAEIKRIDDEWMKAETQLPIQKEKLNNA